MNMQVSLHTENTTGADPQQSAWLQNSPDVSESQDFFSNRYTENIYLYTKEMDVFDSDLEIDKITHLNEKLTSYVEYFDLLSEKEDLEEILDDDNFQEQLNITKEAAHSLLSFFKDANSPEVIKDKTILKMNRFGVMAPFGV